MPAKAPKAEIFLFKAMLEQCAIIRLNSFVCLNCLLICTYKLPLHCTKHTVNIFIQRMSVKIAKNIQDAFVETFSTDSGKIVLNHLFASLDMDNTTFVVGDPYYSAWKEGRRSVYMEILKHSHLDLTPFYLNEMKRKGR